MHICLIVFRNKSGRAFSIGLVARLHQFPVESYGILTITKSDNWLIVCYGMDYATTAQPSSSAAASVDSPSECRLRR